jgi:glycosyltransferase involved in cell wall biosynthesis
MKIAIVTDAWEPQVNGVVRTLKMTCRELEALGHTVEIISPQGFRSLPCPTYPDIRLALATKSMVARVLDAIEPDCLHIATEGPLGWAARAVALQRGWSFTTAYHSRFPEYLQLRTGIPVGWSYNVLRRFHNASSAALVPTESMAADLRAQGFTTPTLWSRGVNLAAFHPDGPRLPRGDAAVFLYVGRLAVEKDVDAFLRLDLPGEKWVAGAGPEEARLRASYPGVRWFGVLQGDELARLYRSADVMVFPSRTDTFGLVLIESMACGTPVAALPVTGPVDVVGHCGAGGALHRDLKTACLVALHGSKRPAVRAFAERYTWAAATQQFVQALRPISRSQSARQGVRADCAAPPTSQ